MKSSFKLALAGIGLLGVIAAVLWMVRQQPTQPQPQPAGAQPPAPSQVPAASPLAEAPSPVEAPEAPSAVEAPSAPSPGEAAVAFGNDLVIKTPADAPKVLQLAIENAGGAKALEQAERATYEHFLAGAVTAGGKMWIDGGKGLVAQTDDVPGTTWLTGPDQCWHQRDGVTAPCPQRLQKWYTIQRHLHAATLIQPLTRPPYKLVSANAGPVNGKLHNMLVFQVGEQELVLLLEVKGQTPVRLEFTPVKGGTGSAVRVDLDDVRSFGQVKVPALRRISMQVSEKREEWQTMTDRVVDLRPGIETGQLKPPTPTAPGPLPQITRPPVPAVAVEVGQHAAFGPKTAEVTEILGADAQALGGQLLEALGPGGKDEGVVMWIVPRQAAGLGDAARKRLKTLPGALVAQTLLRVKVDEVPVAAQKVAAQKVTDGVAKAGQGPVVVRYCSDPDPATKEVTVVVQVPVE